MNEKERTVHLFYSEFEAVRCVTCVGKISHSVLEYINNTCQLQKKPVQKKLWFSRKNGAAQAYCRGVWAGRLRGHAPSPQSIEQNPKIVQNHRKCTGHTKLQA